MSQNTHEMSIFGDRTKTKPNIWWSKERPALMKLRDQGVVTKFYVVDWETKAVYDFDIDTNTRGRRVADPRLNRREEDNELFGRATCPSGLSSKPRAGDPFTSDWSKFANRKGKAI